LTYSKPSIEYGMRDGLLYKLKTTFSTPYYLLLQSYLTDLYSQIKFNMGTSSKFPVHSGVHQGSVLGPLLYLIFTADIPTRHDTVIATCADNTAIMASKENPQTASQSLQTHLNQLETWLSNWFVKVNETKLTQVTFTNRRTDYPAVTINGTKLPVTNEVKYLGLILDQKLTWRPHITAKKTQINLKIRQMNWLIGKKSQLTTENKLLLYKAIIKPIWSYGIQLWGCAKLSNTKIIQRMQSKILRMVFNVPWYVSNHTLHKDSKIPFVEDEINRITNRYIHNLAEHSNDQVSQLRVPPEARRRRLHRQWPTDVLQ
jgi:hypothetical protein